MNFIKIISFTLFVFFNICSFSTNHQEKKETILTVAQEKDPLTFDPHFGNDGFSLRINRLLYSRLIEKDSNMKNIPGIAKSWKILTPTEIEFKIFNNIYFQNGEKLNIEDIIFSFERMKNSPRISAFLPPIESIKKIDNETIIMTLKTPFSGVIDQLTHPALSIVSKNYLKNNNKILIDYPIGTGPYKLLKWKPGENIHLKKFENFHGNNKNYDEIIIKIIPLATNRTIALETGEVDLAFSLPVQDKQIIVNNKSLNFISKPSYSYSYVGLNLKKDIFKNKNIRTAIDLAINKNSILEVVLNGEGIIATSPVAKGVFGFNPKLKPSEFNPNKAREILKNKNLKLTLATLSNGIDIKTAELVQNYLNEVGVTVQIDILEPSVYWSKTNNGDYDMFIGAWGTVTGDSDYALFPTHSSTSFGSAGNRTFFSNKEVDRLLKKSRETLSPQEREQYFYNIQEIIVNNKSEIMLFYRNLNAGISKNIKGFDLYPIPIHNYSLGTIYQSDN
nr:ABC transporter substrate-binding protein [uncultured Cetobacterium sp.]